MAHPIMQCSSCEYWITVHKEKIRGSHESGKGRVAYKYCKKLPATRNFDLADRKQFCNNRYYTERDED